MSERNLFGTDGIRGVANVFPMTPELALRLGRAITHVARRGKNGAGGTRLATDRGGADAARPSNARGR